MSSSFQLPFGRQICFYRPNTEAPTQCLDPGQSGFTSALDQKLTSWGRSAMSALCHSGLRGWRVNRPGRVGGIRAVFAVHSD